MMDTKPFWSPTLPTLQLRWSATALAVAMTCWRKYFYHYVLKLRDPERSADLDWGTFVHEALAVFDGVIYAGGSEEDATEAAVRKAMELTETVREHLECLECGTGFDAPALAQREPEFRRCTRCGMSLIEAWHVRRREKVEFWASDKTNKTRATLLRAVANYADDLTVIPPLVLGGSPVAEVKFELAPMDGFTIYGRLDGLIGGDYGRQSAWIRERKSTKSALSKFYFSTFAPHVEVSVQSLAAREGWAGAAGVRIQGVMIEAIQTGVGFVRFGRERIVVSEERTEEFKRTLTRLWGDARRNAEAGMDTKNEAAWPMNESACYNCHFRGLCAKAPSVRHRFYEEFKKEQET